MNNKLDNTKTKKEIKLNSWYYINLIEIKTYNIIKNT